MSSLPENPEPPEVEASAGPREAELRDRLLRLAAEFENYKKRREREEEERNRHATFPIVRGVVVVLDDLDRALEHAGTADARLVEGLRLVRAGLWDVLETHGVRAIDATGKPFDPLVHEAVAREAREGVAPGTVLEVVQAGYALHGRLVRAARVKVAEATSGAGRKAEGRVK